MYNDISGPSAYISGAYDPSQQNKEHNEPLEHKLGYAASVMHRRDGGGSATIVNALPNCPEWMLLNRQTRRQQLLPIRHLKDGLRAQKLLQRALE